MKHVVLHHVLSCIPENALRTFSWFQHMIAYGFTEEQVDFLDLSFWRMQVCKFAVHQLCTDKSVREYTLSLCMECQNHRRAENIVNMHA
jgi:hypothetical protein